MKITDDAGIRMVRSREIALGDLVADSYRAATGADLAYINGGGIRADLTAGDISYSDIINVTPYGNMICTTEVTGQEIADMLEGFYQYVRADYVENGVATGEDGSFGHFSGLKCVVHTDIPSSAERDENGLLVRVGKTRRVSDIQIMKDGKYVPLDPKQTYVLACTDYMLKNGGNGMALMMEKHTPLLDDIGADYQILVDYIVSLNNDFSRYRTSGERIVIR